MLLTPGILALTLALFAVAAIPTRRLFLAGAGRDVLTAYFLTLIALGFLAASGLGPERLVVPCLVVAFMAPLVASPGLVRRAVRRFGRPEKDVPPRDPP